MSGKGKRYGWSTNPSSTKCRPKDKVVAIKSYKGLPCPSSSRSTLKFNMNDVIDFISCDLGWMEGELNGKRGYFPQSYVKALTTRNPSMDFGTRSQAPDYMNFSSSDIDIDSQPWYAGEMTRDVANEKLEGLPEGTFIVRKSVDGRGDHAISVQYCGVKHIKIGKTKDADESVFLVAAMTFQTITGLVEFHQKNSLVKLFPDVKTALILPYKNAVLTSRDLEAIKNKEILGFCVAKYDYAATAPNHLTLKRGDRLAILSKSGDERGWWKGFLNGKSGFFPKSYVKE